MKNKLLWIGIAIGIIALLIDRNMAESQKAVEKLNNTSDSLVQTIDPEYNTEFPKLNK